MRLDLLGVIIGSSDAVVGIMDDDGDGNAEDGRGGGGVAGVEGDIGKGGDGGVCISRGGGSVSISSLPKPLSLPSERSSSVLVGPRVVVILV